MKLIKLLVFLLIAVLVITSVKAQESKSTPTAEEMNDHLNGIDENVTTLLNDVAGLKKIKLSGYIQFQFDKTQKVTGFNVNPYSAQDSVQSRFSLRRGRVKLTYDAGISQLVFQADITNAGLTMKDAYFNITDPWTKEFSFKAGLFNRPVYEVEYSSSQRESPERSKIITTLYPKERDLGAMLTYQPKGLFKLQLAAFNNTFQGTLAQNNPNFSEEPFYFMGRITKSVKINNDLGIDFGFHGRYGNISSNSPIIIESKLPSKTKLYDSSASNKGMAIERVWFGAEAQIYWDFLGGMKVLGEYIMGSDVNELSLLSVNPAKAVRKRNISGYYITLVKNITKDWQVAAKYDSYNPNTSIKISQVDAISELSTNTFGVGIHNYSFDNVRITLWYDMIKTATNDLVLKEDQKDNLFTLRLQYKF